MVSIHRIGTKRPLTAARRGGTISISPKGWLDRRDGVTDGARTRDNRYHKPGLYQLSYGHRLSAHAQNSRERADRHVGDQPARGSGAILATPRPRVNLLHRPLTSPTVARPQVTMSSDPDSKPSTTAFKEWSVICQALGSGRQSIIMRKGGIHEGRAGFQFQHDGFALFPTRFHEQEQHVRPGELPDSWEGQGTEFQIGELVSIDFWAQLEGVWTVTDWQQIAALEPLHIWNQTTIHDRFECALSDGDPPALNIALIRAFRLGAGWEFPYERGHGGCRSWIEVPSIPDPIWQVRQPVLNDDAFAAIKDQLASLIDR